MISAAITSVFAIASFFTNSDSKELNYLLDPWIFADAILLIILGIFLFRKSRVASTILVIYFVASKALMWYELGTPSGLIISILFFLYYATAMQGTYLWRSKYNKVID